MKLQGPADGACSSKVQQPVRLTFDPALRALHLDRDLAPAKTGTCREDGERVEAVVYSLLRLWALQEPCGWGSPGKRTWAAHPRWHLAHPSTSQFCHSPSAQPLG